MKIHCLYDQLVSIKDLKQHPKNRNIHTTEQEVRLAEILNYQGWRYPIKVSNQSGFITAGHGRLLAAQRNNWSKVPVSFQNYESEEQEYADLISDNAIASWSELDLSAINTDIADLGPDFNIDYLGLQNFNIDLTDKLDPQCDEDEAPEPAAKAISCVGEIYHLGRHKLLCGDATQVADIEKLMGSDRADMVWTDPPYNIAYEGKHKDGRTIQNDNMSGENFYQFLYDAYSNMLMFTKAGGAIYVAHADSEGMNFRKAMVDSGWMIKQCLIWVKQALVIGRQDYHWKHEPILYGWAPGASHNWYADRKQTTVLEFNRPFKNAEHLTMKPIELIEYCLTNSCAPSGLVLDLFGGSGSTLIACEKSGRKSALVELDPKYCDVIIKRWQNFTGKKGYRQDGIAWEDLKKE